MPLRLFNTYSRAVEAFHPLDSAGREVKMYTCGPTVYDHAHIGNFRAYLFEDLLHRYLELREFKVRRVMNITDVDDKTIQGSRTAGVPLAEFTSPFKQAFFEDLDTLRIKRADVFPAATDPAQIAAMIEMIKTLIARELAYQAEDKSVYFRINRFPKYGQLAHFDLSELRSTGRVRNDEYDKEHVGDFALWKAWNQEDGPVRWESPWGPGRPGWHIECSAMATQLLGEQLDIHCGGVDNIFPHHEAEIAQTEGCTGKQFVRYWVHCAHLMVDGQKMSKSLGNFYTVRDVLAKGYSGREVRYALMRVHYRAPLNFTWEGMEESRQALNRVDDWVARLEAEAKRNTLQRPAASAQPPSDGSSGFEEALDDDLNISGALGFLFEIIRETNRALDLDNLDSSTANHWLRWWERVNSVLAVTGRSHSGVNASDPASIPEEIAALAEARLQARLAKDWEKVMNCATNSLIEAGKSATRKMVSGLRVALESRNMFAPAELLSLEHTAHSKLFESQKYVWDALKQIASYLQFRLKPAVLGELIGKPFISNTVFVGAGTIVEQGAVLKGPAWIGENCHIRSGCYIRENVIVGDGVVMGNSCEFKNCILFDEVQVPHFNYVGDSILGFRAHLGAGVILSNVKLNHQEIHVSATDGDIATGLRKFGAIIGDRTEIGCNAVINPGSVLGRDCLVYPGVNFRGVLPDSSVVKIRQNLQVLTRRTTDAS